MFFPQFKILFLNLRACLSYDWQCIGLNGLINLCLIRINHSQEQLGYSVSCNVFQKGGAQGLLIGVESEKHPHYLDSRIEAFLEHALVSLKFITVFLFFGKSHMCIVCSFWNVGFVEQYD